MSPGQWNHHPRRHAAARTNEYIYSQLIPYIGNKRKLLDLISRAILTTKVEPGSSFVDLFAGSTVVARLAKTMGFRILANDWEPYSCEISRGTVKLNAPPDYAQLGGPQEVFRYLNRLSGLEGYVTQHLCPKDDDNPDLETERMFFTRKNGVRIDAMREKIAEWELAGRISPGERSYILASFAYAVSYVSNTSGVFKAFHRGWGGKTGTALYRILSDFTVRQPVLFDNQMRNLATQEDAHEIAPRLDELLGHTADIVYLDPPYNQHPYGSNYHVLNTVVLWDKPSVRPVTQVNGRTVDKSAIRKDWRTERRSPYNHARLALPALRRLVESIDARWLLMSYSTDGNMPLRGVLSALAERGDLHVFMKPYKRYRVSTPRMSPKPLNVELLAVVNSRGRPSVSKVDALIAEIVDHERQVLGNGTRPPDPSLFG